MPLSFAKRLLTICCLLTTHSAIAGGSSTDNSSSQQSFIKPYRAVYNARFDTFLPFEGKAIRQLQQQPNGQWLLSHTIDSGILSLKETSLFNWQNQQPRTQTYQYKQNSIGKNKIQQLDFDWVALEAHHETDKAPGSFTIPVNALDKLTYQLKMRQDLQSGKEIGVYSVADKRKLKEYGFILLGTEELNTPVGKLKTVKIKRDRGPDNKRETTFWLASDWDYLLVKIQQKEKGKDYKVVLFEGELNGKPIIGL